MMNFDSRKYVGLRFGLSVSAPDEDDLDWPKALGDKNRAVNRFVYDEANNFLLEGARLVLGHSWKDSLGRWDEDGILNHLARDARILRQLKPDKPDPTTGIVPPPILNFLAWPDQPPPDSEALARRLVQQGLIQILQVLPSGMENVLPDLEADWETAKAFLQTDLGQFARIRALTSMRRELVRQTEYRLFVGGPGRNLNPTPSAPVGARRLPGIIEEAILTHEAGQPLYVSSAFGGAAKAIADTLLQRKLKMNADSAFITAPEVAELMTRMSEKYPISDIIEGPSIRGGWNAEDYFGKLSLKLDLLAKNAGLETDGYVQMLATPIMDVAMSWMLTGVSNLRGLVRPGLYP